MSRTTILDVRDLVRVINRRLEKHGYTHRVGLEPVENRATRATMLDENKTVSTIISPDLRTGLLHQWLTAYWKGLSLGLMKPE